MIGAVVLGVKAALNRLPAWVVRTALAETGAMRHPSTQSTIGMRTTIGLTYG